MKKRCLALGIYIAETGIPLIPKKKRKESQRDPRQDPRFGFAWLNWRNQAKKRGKKKSPASYCVNSRGGVPSRKGGKERDGPT